MLGVWILGYSLASLRSGGLPKALAWFGVATALTTIAFALGYATGVRWLGEIGIGASAFIALPTWMIWLGIILWRSRP